jgi:hypothetical protein
MLDNGCNVTVSASMRGCLVDFTFANCKLECINNVLHYTCSQPFLMLPAIKDIIGRPESYII